jgi:CheY-like chemotaxis protein/MinD-like ATPase involved in chromosome partitioning or flagellar assembly
MAEKILVVDDDVDTLRLVGLMLERQGYEIVAANSGQQALAMVLTERPDLILLDLMMPDIDGVEVCRRLRASPETKDILIIMFTAKSQTDDKIVGFDAGADDYLTKPTQPRELIAHVKAVLKRTGKAAVDSSKVYTDRGHVLGVISTKGGVGVSTIALNLGIALYNQNKESVIVSDFRPGCGSIGLELGYATSMGFDRLISQDSSTITSSKIEEELTLHTSGVRFLLSSPLPQSAKFCNEVEGFSAILNSLVFLASYIVLDLGVSVTPVNEKVLEECDQVILVFEPVTQTILQTKSFIEYLFEKGLRGDHLTLALVNRLRAGMQLPLGQVQEQLGRSVSAIFTASPELAYQALVYNTPMILRQPDGITAEQFTSLAKNVIQQIG